MTKTYQAIRGMNDILPEHAALWQTLQQAVTEVFASYGYNEIRLPIVERTDLFARSIGEVTDIVEKEMYSFEDRGGESLSLRPEGTAGCVRAAIQHGLLHNQVQRLWYGGPMFRYERPQKGRYRQFHQFGAEAFGLAGPDIDAELITMSARLWRRLGLKNLTLQLNSLGTPESRQHYRDALVEYFTAHKEVLDEDSQRRLGSNPMRILDSKNPVMAEMLADAPSILDHLDAESRTHFDQVCALLGAAGVEYRVNPRVVRGLDYYSRTVFEWTTEQLGAQDAVCSGGRYDGLVTQLGGKPTPAIGFAMGVERLIALMELQKCHVIDNRPQVFMVRVGENAERYGAELAEQLRDALPDMRLLVHAGGGSFKSQLKKADKSGAEYALILGEEEVVKGQVQLKALRSAAGQLGLDRNEIVDGLAQRLNLQPPVQG